jgi:hypothetical protein
VLFDHLVGADEQRRTNIIRAALLSHLSDCHQVGVNFELKNELKTEVKMSGISRMLCVYRGQSYIGFILHRGTNGFEAFDTGEHSIG